MIPIHELQIGSWVKFPFAEAQIIKLTPSNAYYANPDGSIDYPFGNLKPIPLTQEWLKRMGFLRLKAMRGFAYIKDNYNYTIGQSESGFVFYNSPGNPGKIRDIQYVHQLQLFWAAVTGEKLEVK